MAPISIALRDYTCCITEEHHLLLSQLIATSVSRKQIINYHPSPEFEKDNLNVALEWRVRIEIAM